MGLADKGSTAEEVESRLDDIFGEAVPADDSASFENIPLRDLKSTISTFFCF